MITVQDKLKLFTKRIIEKRQEAYDEKVHQLEDKMVVELAERKKMLERDRKRYEETLLKGIKSEKAQRLSNARSERKRRLLLKRKTMIDTLLEGVKEYTKSFVKSDKYKKYLLDLLHDHKEDIMRLERFQMYLNTDDMQYADELKKLLESFGCICDAVEVYERPLIGGMIFYQTDGALRIDLTLDSTIEDNKKYMGQLIYDLLEEAGEVNE